ncbi:hypothetical protein Mgra_00004996 [Meloidogyne graminicola]|uniref:Prolyl 4-hydroxylase alpha subunit domain-containing protein n=1 Tax=Meloidogyne graminicola TaxID=189291 RepID=A0A8S9ZRC1_9BILA|nr:hypothetical protein Mgra_00004996 [Meloidogyne graminicola]
MASSIDSVSIKFTINEAYKNDDFKNKMITCLEGKHESSYPFPHFHLIDFITNSKLIKDLRNELHSVAWLPKCNDLYSLNQTVDIANLQEEHYPYLYTFYQFLLNDVRRWLMSMTGVQLGEKLALTGSRYLSGDCLLTHDDKLEGRAFAFVLYLNVDWTETDGGDLCLYNCNPSTNQPEKIVKRIRPIENSFSLFRVQNNSWHSVSEVLSEGKERLSLNGWFHYPENMEVLFVGDSPIPEEPIPRTKPSMDTTLAEVTSWLNNNYVGPGQHKHIKRIFARKSQLSLRHFLNSDKYTAALDELETAHFTCIGPPNKRNVWRLTESQLSENSHLRSLLRLFRSEAITLLLTQWTGLHLHEIRKISRGNHKESSGGEDLATTSDNEPPSKKSKLSKKEEIDRDVELVSFINRFDQGCYSMADDQLIAHSEDNGFSLDVILFLGRKQEWPAQNGGFISYFACGEEDEIIRVIPSFNTAAIVFREPGVLNFTKYVNHRAGSDTFFTLNCTFFGICTGESESEDSSLDSENIADESEDEEEEEEENYSEEFDKNIHEETEEDEEGN